MLLTILDPVLLEEINLVSHLFHLCEVGAELFLAQLDGQIFHIPLFRLVIDDERGLHDLKQHHEEGQDTRDPPHRVVICVY